MILQFLGLVATATLLFICVMLAQTKNTHVFVVVGQDVFRWMSYVLAAILLTRALTAFTDLTSEQGRSINSLVFIVAVCGIVWSVRQHGRAAHKR